MFISFVSDLEQKLRCIGSLSLLLLLASVDCHAAESVLWQQFKQAKLADTEPTLPDFSYAGYDYSETPIPDTSGWAVFNVTTYGAIADDDLYDDAAIQAAIDAAEAAGGGIVFFPPGRFMISPNETVGENIFVNGSNIVLQGSGSGAGGTEIFKDKMKVENGRYIFEVTPTSTSESTVTTVVSAAPRESYEIEVADATGLSVGQRIILRCDSVAYGNAYFAPQTIDPAWTRLLDPSRGFNMRELHTVAAISGNTVTLREPLHLPMIITADPINVRTYNMISNVGVEDILFKGNWDSYPEVFEHHKDDIHDYAWNALRFDNVENGWMRNCEFKDWNQCIYFDGCAAFTVESVHFTGKKGHTSIHTRRSYGMLIKDCVDTAAHHHGCGIGYWGCGTVYLRHQMAADQRMDSHSGSPYATLFDSIQGGKFDGNGGPYESYPHHAKYFVAWNFTVNGGTSTYDFWPSSRNGHTFAMPIFAGLQGDSVTLAAGTYLENESPGVAVEPASLFEAQLQFRLGPTTETLGATAMTTTSATLNGDLISTGQAAAVAGFYWGTSDGGTDPGAWDHFIDLGSATAGAMTATLNSLDPNQSYWYRAWASNQYYVAWASESVRINFVPETVIGSILNPENFTAINANITSATGALTFDTDTLEVSGGVTGYGAYGVNDDGSQVAIFSFLDVDLTTAPVITGSLPFVLLSKGNLRLDTDINVDGGKGGHAYHGVGLAGGGDGGDANRSETPGNPFHGQGPGGSLGNSSGLEDNTPGGGGFGGAGGTGGDGIGTGGVTYGDALLSSLIGGSGAGGSRNKGGGAGGGAIALVAADMLEITSAAKISAEGGFGTGSSGQLTSGGGSGGAILIRGKDVIINGDLDVSGGNGGNASGGQSNGGAGGGGRIAIFYHTSIDTTGSSMNVDGGLPVGTVSTAQPGAAGTIHVGLDDDGLADQWLMNETAISSPTVEDWLVDYDGDRLSARIEYSLGGSTSTSDGALLPELAGDGLSGFDFVYNRRQSGIDFADYIVESSTDLVLEGWMPLVPESVEVVPHPSLSGFDRVIVTLPNGDTHRFIRLRIR